jgi:hypothetical protein
MYTLVGSQAMRWHFRDSREPKDWDWYVTGDDVRTYLGVPFEHNDMFTDDRIAAWNWGMVATPDELYTIKVSHSFWIINTTQNWDKHTRDIVFLKAHGAQFLPPLYDILRPIWADSYRRHTVSLDKTAKDFFDDAVDRKYDHDSIHETIAYGDRPLYESVLKAGSEVAVDNAKFRAMDLGTQLNLVREEVYATALERWLIPNDYHGSPTAAYVKALRKTATSLFKGDWALFLMLNVDKLLRPDVNYVRRHKDNIHRLRLNGDTHDLYRAADRGRVRGRLRGRGQRAERELEQRRVRRRVGQARGRRHGDRVRARDPNRRCGPGR